MSLPQFRRIHVQCGCDLILSLLAPYMSSNGGWNRPSLVRDLCRVAGGRGPILHVSPPHSFLPVVNVN